MYYRMARLSNINPIAISHYVSPRYIKLTDLKKDIIYAKCDKIFPYVIIKFIPEENKRYYIEFINC